MILSRAHLRRSQAGESDTRVASGVILLTKHITKMKDISLGGIDEKNVRKLNMIKPFGFAGISYFEKKKAPKNQGP